MEVIASENYLAESPQSVAIELAQSLYADEPPEKRLKSTKQVLQQHSKLAETVGFENTIMLNAEDLAKASSARIPHDDTLHEKNLSQSRQTRSYVYNYAAPVAAVTTRRQYYEANHVGSPASNSDMNQLGTTTETARCTSVIQQQHGMTNNNRKRVKNANSESESEDGNIASAAEREDGGGLLLDKSTEYGHLRCYEQFDGGNNMVVRGNYVAQNSSEPAGSGSRLDSAVSGSRIQGDQSAVASPDRISEKFSGRGVSAPGARCFRVMDGRAGAYATVNQPLYLQHHDMNNQYHGRMQQHPPDYGLSQAEQRGAGGSKVVQQQQQATTQYNAFVEPASSNPGMVVAHGYPGSKFTMPHEGLFATAVQQQQVHADMAASTNLAAANPFSQVGSYNHNVYETTRSPASSTSSGKDRECEQEGFKTHVQHFPSPVGNMKEEYGQGSPRQGKIPDDSSVDGKQQDGHKPKAKRNAKGENTNKCQQCFKTFASSSALAKHKLTHSDERRYVCNICGKGFKRQDHLNGHTLTHRDKKPYECKFSDCDKSYCDMRSLRRHYENYHPSPDGTPPVVGSSLKSQNDSSKSQKNNNNNNNSKVEESSKADIAEKQQIHDMRSKQDVLPTGMGRRKRNSDSMCSNNSDDFNRRLETTNHSPHLQSVSHDKPTSAMSMLKQVVEHSQDIKMEKKNVEGYQGYYPIQDGFRSQWFNAYAPHVFPLYQLNNNNQQSMVVPQPLGPFPHNGAFCPVDPPQLVPNYPPVSQMNKSNGEENARKNVRRSEDDHGLLAKMAHEGSTQATDPTSIAIVNAEDRRARFKDVNSSFAPVVQWKSVPVKDSSGMPPFSMGNSPLSSMQHNPVNLGDMVPEHHDDQKREQPPTQLNICIPPYHGEKRSHDDTEHKFTAKRQCPPLPSSNGAESLLKVGDTNPDSNTEDVFRNPPVTPPRKPRPRPEPINIPASNFAISPMSPPIYTPPPMLSPRSIFHISNTSLHTPRVSGSTPLTPSRFFLGNRSRKNSLEAPGGESDQAPEMILPEPKINIGPLFQADVPRSVAPRKHADFDKHRVSVCWIPFERESKKRAQEIESFLDMACSVAVHGGGSNKEYALHVLFRLKGNIKQAVRHILANKSAIQKGDGLADYHYQGSVKWSGKERLKFREVLSEKGKDFFLISKEFVEDVYRFLRHTFMHNELTQKVSYLHCDLPKSFEKPCATMLLGTKSVAQCVEFYYLWKATHPEAMRCRTRYVETESESETVEYFSDDGNSTYVFECDFPGCNSKFISRQALNGHIRVHGGSFMKPAEPKRTRVKTTASETFSNNNNNNSNQSTTTTSSASAQKNPVGRPPTKAAQKTTTTGAPVIPYPDGTLPEFACKVCGRIFHKIKSRSAHMKTHVKRNDDDHIGSK